MTSDYHFSERSFSAYAMSGIVDYVTFQEGDNGVVRAFKGAIGLPTHLAFISANLVECAVTHLLLILVKTGQFITFKNYSGWIDHRIFEPLFLRSMTSTALVGIATSRVVTSFKGKESVHRTDQSIWKGVESTYNSPMVNNFKDIHIDGFAVRSIPAASVSTDEAIAEDSANAIPIAIAVAACGFLVFQLYRYFEPATSFDTTYYGDKCWIRICKFYCEDVDPCSPKVTSDPVSFFLPSACRCPA